MTLDGMRWTILDFAQVTDIEGKLYPRFKMGCVSEICLIAMRLAAWSAIRFNPEVSFKAIGCRSTKLGCGICTLSPPFHCQLVSANAEIMPLGQMGLFITPYPALYNLQRPSSVTFQDELSLQSRC